MTENIKKFKELKHLEAHAKKEKEIIADERKTYEGEIDNLKKYIKRLDDKKTAIDEKLNTHLNYTQFAFKASDIKLAFAKLMNIDVSRLGFNIVFHKERLSSNEKINVLQYVSTIKEIYVSIYADDNVNSLTNGMCFKVSIEDLLNKNHGNIDFVCDKTEDGRYLSRIEIKEGRKNDLVLVMNAKYLMDKDSVLVEELLKQDAISAKKKPSIN